jgi:hypothetical protein
MLTGVGAPGHHRLGDRSVSSARRLARRAVIPAG